MVKKFLFMAAIAGALLAASVGKASAEFFVDAYIGPAFTQDGKFAHGPNFPATTRSDTVVSGGARIGYFFIPYIGVALDVSHYQPDGKFRGGGSGFFFDSPAPALSIDPRGLLPVLACRD